MILTSHQPDFIPYMGFFWKVAHCDMLVFSDDVQFSKSGMHNWNRIKSPSGVTKITIPVHAHHDTPICDVMIADVQHSLKTAIKTIEQNYSKAAHYREGRELLDLWDSYSKCHELSMMELNLNSILLFIERFGIWPKRMMLATGFQIYGHKDERIFQMCYKTGADTYLSGHGAAAYHQPAEYEKRKIRLLYTDYQPISYPQLYGEFVPNLSALDYVFNCGFELPRGWQR